jgi:hypothetical protein
MFMVAMVAMVAMGGIIPENLAIWPYPLSLDPALTDRPLFPAQKPMLQKLPCAP